MHSPLFLLIASALSPFGQNASEHAHPKKALHLDIGPTYALQSDGEGGVLGEGVKGFEVGTGLVLDPHTGPMFVDFHLAYSPKLDFDGVGLLRGGISMGPSIRIGEDSRLRLGAGLGFTKAFAKISTGTSFTLFGMAVYAFPIDDHFAAFTLNYAHNLGPLATSKSEAFNTYSPYGSSGGTSYNTWTPIPSLHDFSIKFEWLIPIGDDAQGKPSKE